MNKKLVMIGIKRKSEKGFTIKKAKDEKSKSKINVPGNSSLSYTELVQNR